MSCYKCIIWGAGLDYELFYNAVKYQEVLGHVEIVGVTSNQPIYKELDGNRFITKSELNYLDFDLLIISSMGKFSEIRCEALSIGVDPKKIISMKVFSLPGFHIDKYMSLLNSNLTIFSINCWGGLTYNRLGMEFLSPFINMYVNETDYLKLLRHPKSYLTHEPTLVEYRYEPTLQNEYPICRIDDVELHFNHYTTVEHAIDKWNSRKVKVNWDNLFVMMYTTDPEVASRFIDLPYENKVCFVPFTTSEASLLPINYSEAGELRNVPFWAIVNGLAWGTYKLYDVFELLNGNYNDKRINIRGK